MHQCARDVPQCMTPDQSEAAIPKVYLLWLEPGNWRRIKASALGQQIHSERRHTQLVRDIICLKPIPLKRKAPPPKGKEKETTTRFLFQKECSVVVCFVFVFFTPPH